MDKFDDFIFFGELKDELEKFDNEPETITRALCFHGLPGIGKTSFAKYLATKHAKRVLHLDMNDGTEPFVKDGWKTTQQGWKKFIGFHSMDEFAVDATEKYFNVALILDEWNDIEFKKQNRWKVAIEEMYELETFKILIIICLNTNHGEDKESQKHSLNKMLSPAIKSRCDVVEFSPYDGDEKEVIKAFKKRYPYLSERKLKSAYPDLRSIVHMGDRTNN